VVAENPMNRKDLRWFFLIAISWISFGIYKGCQSDKNREQQIENLVLELSGVVEYIDIPSGYNGFGIVGVKVLYSNQQNIPIKNPNNAQYCVVKEKQAEFYQYSPELCNIGDTVYVNTSTETFLITKPNTNPIDRGILLNDDERFWKYVLKHTKL
jgi:hypothetical protein